MATKTPKTAIVIDTDEKPAIKGLKNLVKAYGSAATQINQGLELVTKGWGFVSGAITATVDVLGDYVELAAEQERVELRVLAAIRRKTSFTDQEFDALQRNNAERQRALGIGDEAQLQLQGTLIAMGVSADQLDSATEATIGLADATGQDLNAAGKLVARTLGGEVTALKRYGITVGSVAEASEEMAGLFKVASAQSDTLSVKMKALDAAVGDAKEVLGATVNNSRDLKDIFDALTDSVEDLSQILGGASGVTLINEMSRALAGLAADALNAALGALALKRAVEDFDQEQTGGRVDSFLAVINPFQSDTDRLSDLKDLIEGKEATERPASATEAAIARLADLAQKIRTRKREPGGPGPALVPLVGPGSAGFTPPGKGGSGSGLSLSGDVFGVQAELDAETARAESLADLKDLIRLDELDSEFEFRDRQLAAQEAANDRQVASMEQHAEEMRGPGELISATMQRAVTAGIAGMATALSEGENIVSTLRGFFGGIVVSLGNTLIQMGSAALAVSLLSVIPVFTPMTGPPGLSAAAGAAALVAGAGLVAVGSAMGGKGGKSAASGRGGAGSGSFTQPSLPEGEILPGGFQGGPGFGGQPQASVINVNFNTPIDSRRARRELQDLMVAG